MPETPLYANARPEHVHQRPMQSCCCLRSATSGCFGLRTQGVIFGRRQRVVSVKVARQQAPVAAQQGVVEWRCTEVRKQPMQTGQHACSGFKAVGNPNCWQCCVLLELPTPCGPWHGGTAEAAATWQSSRLLLFAGVAACRSPATTSKLVPGTLRACFKLAAHLGPA